MSSLLRLTLLSALALFGVGCASNKPTVASKPVGHRVHHVRTTAYTHTEAGGRRNAVGTRLSASNVKSAAADWSRWPLGTKFRIVDTNEVFQIDDYGSALVGTGTIDLYRSNRLEMRKWGVRSVDIDVIEWGSREESLRVLAPRKNNKMARRMMVALAREPGESPLPKF
jgi:3D (Asp-Asp-Asp) domain-containing protein